MSVVQEKRPARNPLQEGLAMAPYLLLYQRLHARRWAMGAGALVLGAALGWLWIRRDDLHL